LLSNRWRSDILIIKPCTKPINLEKLEALVLRTPKKHPKRSIIESDYAKRLAGFKGEQSLEYYLSFLPEKEFHILFNLRLSENSRYFQMDTILIYSSCIIIIEVKNIKGTLTFDQKGKQLIRTIDGVDECYPCPILQVNRHKLQLRNWLKIYNIPSVPIETLVVITNPSTFLKTVPINSPLQTIVIRNPMLPEKIETIIKKYPEEKLALKDIKKLSKLFIKHNEPYDPDVLQYYEISESDLLTGVYCPQCQSLPMVWTYGKWHCCTCSLHSKVAHIPTIKEYSLLINSTITNRETKRFLHLPSESISKKLLQSMKLPYSGTTKDREYYLS
jgi:hypothetical protein